ncbi:hypothetical protein K470DRAFT_274965 [Piedraia hortae CBS 480.64]|uniref:Kinase-like protein n=1 Tax=Piedraia hortae CBS 480.64 TaxID=1314780 RepID=A0A6A7C691_9PEZI|nr:hypothetical protein K470DRAFT_274965 [Piedraia hortae CBS 480.64]
MANSEDLIDFSVIESHKENIQALPSGRSARALAQLYSPPLNATPSPSLMQDANSAARIPFEQELATIDEADDPLDFYDRYVKWTLDAYPSAQATPQSRLLPLLERGTKEFQSSARYKNDPRYLKLWLHYIRLFSDAPREVFVFLARHGIGENLALYYEEFASWLETAGRWQQAEEVYRLGLEKEATPTARLLRKFGEFERRKESRPAGIVEPTSPALPTVRPALAAKVDPFSASSPAAPQQSRAPAPKKNKSKMAIFSDSDESRPASTEGASWDNLGTLASRKKENSVEAKPWAGETLKGGKTNGGMHKLMIFKDERCIQSKTASRVPKFWSGKPSSQCMQNPKTGRMDCVFVNLETVYPEVDGSRREYCFEELRAQHRGWLDQDWSPKEPKQRRGFDIFQDPTLTSKPVQAEKAGLMEEINGENDENAPPQRDAISKKQLRREERQNRTRKLKMDLMEVSNETKVIQLNMDSPARSKPKRIKSAERADPTMTINTKEAMDEIYGIFNQPLASHAEQQQEEEDSDEEDYTTGDESTATGKLSTATSEYGDETKRELLGRAQPRDDDDDEDEDVTGWSDFSQTKHVPKLKDDTVQSTWSGEGKEEVLTPQDVEPKTRQIAIPPEDYEPPATQVRDANLKSNQRFTYLTPIVEQTESSFGVATVRVDKEYLDSKTPSRSQAPVIEEHELDDSNLEDTVPLPSLNRNILLPIRTKSTKGTIALGAGTASSQTMAVESSPAPVQATKPIITERQCNPMDDAIHKTILSSIEPPLSSYPGYIHHNTVSGRSGEIKKFIKAQQKPNRDATISAPVIVLPGALAPYKIQRELGAGTFAPVYLCTNPQPDEEIDSNPHQTTSRRRSLEAMKMEHPPSPWEFYILRQAAQRLRTTRSMRSIVSAYEFHSFTDECFLIEDYLSQGTLLDLVNSSRSEGGSGSIDESMAMFLTVELLRTVEALHSQGIIHGDLKGDNVLVRFNDPGSEVDWSPRYFPSGAHGWASKGILLIDFGRSIDMRAFEPDVQFVADWKTSMADCREMRELRPWTWQIDYHALAGVIYMLLFGKYIETKVVVEKDDEGFGGERREKIKESLKRYWSTALWGELFDLLLNPLSFAKDEDNGKMPLLNGLGRCRGKMEEWLEENGEKGVGLKMLIAKYEANVAMRKRKGR